MAPSLPSIDEALPKNRDLYYGGAWHKPKNGGYADTLNPGKGEVIGKVAQAGAEDVNEAVEAAHTAFDSWKKIPPVQRANTLRKAASALRENATTLAFLDALDTGNPVAEMLADANVAAAWFDYFAGLIPMLRGDTIPESDDQLHYTLREPLGVVGRIVAFNHPIMFAAGKLAAPLAAGNTVVVKPPDQAPLSSLRLAEIWADIFPPGVVNIMPGGAECGKALTAHQLVRKITLIGSVPTGKAIARTAADTLKQTLFELGGKNALIAFPDADIEKLVVGISRGMNFTWAGQSCGSTSRVFLHESIHDKVLDKVVEYVQANFKPGVPTEMATTMGPVIDQAAEKRVLSYIESGKKEGAKLICGGAKATGDKIDGGYFIEPTIFTNVNHDMKIAREEIFGPVMSVFKWSDEKDMLRQVNDTEYGLTASIYTKDIAIASDIAKKVEVGFVWVNQVARHFLGVPFGGYKASGGGREEDIQEMFAFTQMKTVNVSLAR